MVTFEVIYFFVHFSKGQIHDLPRRGSHLCVRTWVAVCFLRVFVRACLCACVRVHFSHAAITAQMLSCEHIYPDVMLLLRTPRQALTCKLREIGTVQRKLLQCSTKPRRRRQNGGRMTSSGSRSTVASPLGNTRQSSASWWLHLQRKRRNNSLNGETVYQLRNRLSCV